MSRQFDSKSKWQKQGHCSIDPVQQAKLKRIMGYD